jgi:hypothetical protein
MTDFYEKQSQIIENSSIIKEASNEYESFKNNFLKKSYDD